MNLKRTKLYFIPRLLGFLFALFLAMFAFDSFAGDQDWLNKIIGFVFALVPFFISLGLLFIAHYFAIFGGFMYILIGISFIFQVGFDKPVFFYLLIAGPLFVIGILFIIERLMQVSVEFVDIVKKDGTLTSEKRSKKTVHSQGLWHQTVHVWIYNSKGEILLQKRSKQKIDYPGKWDISVAGHVKSGETYEQAVLREVKEELGIKINLESLQKTRLYNHVTEKPEKKYFNKEITQEYILKLDKSIDQFKFKKDEVETYKFISPDKLRELLKTENGLFVYHSENYYFEIIETLSKIK